MEEESDSDSGLEPVVLDGETSEWSETDEEQPGTSARPMGAMPCVPRTEHVDDNLRGKIRRGEFVDFKNLIPHPRGEKPRKRFSLSGGCFEEIEDTTNPVMYNWIDAFVVFMSINLEFHPSHAQGMLRHLQVVKRMHAGGRDGVEYDFQFRRMKCRFKSIQWGEYLPELAGEVQDARMPKRSARRVAPYMPPQRTQRTGAGRQLCRAFNSLRGCKFGPTCRFGHQCSKCSSAEHPVHRCSKT